MAGSVGRALATLDAVGSPTSGVVKRKAALTKALLLVGKHADIQLTDDPDGAREEPGTLPWAAVVDAALLAIDGACKPQRGSDAQASYAPPRRPREGAGSAPSSRAPPASSAAIAGQAAQLLAAAAAAGALACLVSRGRRIVKVAIKCLARVNRSSIAPAVAQ
ncbi:hypothetical protein FNF27_03627 [Cafeteria roenbergensis]|uniref:Uncharacterized protein n=1 Tax=Cafeteria roenbergensis TaxID=33653 RepID=A0A5A8EBE7_CAFRO|nr:hypothetical protein FNF27_03627 [Cafeteria roenbergensis]